MFLVLASTQLLMQMLDEEVNLMIAVEGEEAAAEEEEVVEEVVLVRLQLYKRMM